MRKIADGGIVSVPDDDYEIGKTEGSQLIADAIRNRNKS